MRRHAPLFLAVFFFGAAFFGWKRLRNERELDRPATLLGRLPTKDAAVLSIDFAALRNGGILDLLAKSKVPEEPEYRAFVHNSNFDYKRDLDSALVAFAPDGVFFLVRGRFDWTKLAEYAKSQGGSCYDDLCRMTGSTPSRRISFVPLRQDLMALAVSGDDLAAARLKQPGPQRAIAMPTQPVWLSIAPETWKSASRLPAGARLFTSFLAGTENVTVTLGPEGQAFEARLEALCRSPLEAATLETQLEKTTAMLRNGLRDGLRDNGTDDIGALLTAGVFERSDRKVVGRWTVRKGLLENLASGL